MGLQKLCSIAFLFALTCTLVYAEGEEATPPAEGGAAEEVDETKALLEKLTITMISEVVDERTVIIQESSSKGGKQLLRLGNVEKIEKGSMSDEEYAEKLEAGKNALNRMLTRKMVWYKTAAPEHQPPAEANEDGNAEKIILGDIWTTEGRHVNGLLLKEGHVVAAKHYEEELARDILQAESEKGKEQAYKDLEEAIKESEREKAKAAAEEKKAAKKRQEANEPVEPLGFSGYIGIAVIVGIVGFSVWASFQTKKKNNPNRKRGFFEKLWNKVKGA